MINRPDTAGNVDADNGVDGVVERRAHFIEQDLSIDRTRAPILLPAY